MHNYDHVVVVMRVNYDGVTIRENNFDHSLLCMDLENPGDITVAFRTHLAYFLYEDLEVPPSMKPPTMVLTMKLGSFLIVLK